MTQVLGAGRHLRLVRRAGYEFCERVGISGVVAIVAVNEDDEFVFVEQPRPPVGRSVIEIPAGLVGDSGEETLEEGARRELLEETGYEGGLWRELGAAPPSPGLTSEVLTFFSATALRRTGPGGGDADEEITVHLVPRAEVHDWLAARREAGTLIDLKLYAGLWLTVNPGA